MDTAAWFGALAALASTISFAPQRVKDEVADRIDPAG